MSMYQWNGDVLTEWKRLQDKLDASKNEWESFMRTGKIMNESSLSPEILSSWQRCKDRGLNPYDEGATILSQQQLEQRLEKNKFLIDTARPILQETAGSIHDSGYRVDLYDRDLYLLCRFGKKLNEGDVERRTAVLGESHQEKDTGTTSTNLTALLGKPITVMAYEHYKTRYQSLTCVSAPIMKQNGDLLAVLTVEGFIWPLHKHTMALLIALVDSIESKLRQNVRFEAVLQNKLNHYFMDMMDMAVVFVDGNGKIRMANKESYKTILEGWNNAVGFSCENIWGYRTPIFDVIQGKKPMSNRVIFQGGKKYIVDITPFIDNKGKVQGVVVTSKRIVRNERVNAGVSTSYTFENISGVSEEIKQAIRLARETATMDNNVLITGESGTGKELFAQSIHNASCYSNGPFIVVNCSAIPNSLLESELFGYEGGAFTDAKKGGDMGKFESAAGGTIFLDEINSMSLDMQAKILRVIQNKAIMRIGGKEEIPINVRVIAATNVDLWQMVKRGEFREDLYYRLNVISINVPPLRDRSGDIKILINDILSKLSNKLKQDIQIEMKAMKILEAYSWPGNVRELENVIERSWVIARTNNSSIITEKEVLSYEGIADEKRNSTSKNHAENNDESDENTWDSVEKALIIKTIEEKNGNIQATAKQLGIARNTLYRKMKKYGIRK